MWVNKTFRREIPELATMCQSFFLERLYHNVDKLCEILAIQVVLIALGIPGANSV